MPDPLAWIPWAFVGEGRFDDPDDRYRVLYAGDRRACFLESLAQFRPTLRGTVSQRFTTDWLASRRIASFSIADPERRERWLDLRAPATHQHLRQTFASLLLELDLPDFDLSAATSQRLALTQRIGAWAFGHGCAGIVYPTRFDPALACWAIFERPDGLPFTAIDVRPIARDDPDLLAVADLFQLPLPP
jgi:hypothetical protein